MGRVINHIKTYHFYPRSPCGERPDVSHRTGQKNLISIHALLAESDGVHYDNYNLHCVISIHALLAESDLPINVMSVSAVQISIHALLAESDVLIIAVVEKLSISIHALLAESDQGVDGSGKRSTSFLSTLSLRRAT